MEYFGKNTDEQVLLDFLDAIVSNGSLELMSRSVVDHSKGKNQQQ